MLKFLGEPLVQRFGPVEGKDLTATRLGLKQIRKAGLDTDECHRSIYNLWRQVLEYYHELTHSTGHPARLNRSSLTDFERFGDHNYSREELVAEMGAAFLAGYCGIENRTINNSAAYLANWLKAVKDDSRMVLVAASQAQKAADLILGVTPSDAAQQYAG